MVRLKVFKCEISNNSTFISIPYGAIKRIGANATLGPDCIFQFLMVRLKVAPFCFNFLWCYRISIPYGAIKSTYTTACLLSLNNFNSLWCD